MSRDFHQSITPVGIAVPALLSSATLLHHGRYTLYREHPHFHPPPTDAVLWRYMDFTKFVSLLETQSLFFARADNLGDPFEGAYSKINLAMRQALYKDKIPQSGLSHIAAFEKASRRFIFVNCWHEARHESAAMWRLYSREQDGIAVKTDFASLSQSFTCSEAIHIGRVAYVDYDTTFIPEGNMFFPYLHKRKSFEHDREVRAVSVHLQSDDGKIDISQDIRTTGTCHSVDLSLLVKQVVIAPYADDWFNDLVGSVAVRYGLSAPIFRSQISQSPTWG